MQIFSQLCKCELRLSFKLLQPVLDEQYHVFHPLSMFKSQLLSDDLDLSFSQRDNPPAVLLDDCMCVRDDYLSFGATEGQLWKYSLIDRTLDIISTPEGVVRCHGLAVWSKKLVLVGGQSNDGQTSSYNVWVRQGTTVKLHHRYQWKGSRSIQMASFCQQQGTKDFCLLCIDGTILLWCPKKILGTAIQMSPIFWKALRQC